MLGSTRVVLEAGSGGILTGQYDYEPFGKVMWQSGPSKRLSFIDKEKDKESSLGDFGVRKYDDGIGRFTSIDPLWEKYRSLSPYQYCRNNPLILIDPTGFGDEEQGGGYGSWLQKLMPGEATKEYARQGAEAFSQIFTGGINVSAPGVGGKVTIGPVTVEGELKSASLEIEAGQKSAEVKGSAGIGVLKLETKGVGKIEATGKVIEGKAVVNYDPLSVSSSWDTGTWESEATVDGVEDISITNALVVKGKGKVSIVEVSAGVNVGQFMMGVFHTYQAVTSYIYEKVRTEDTK